MALSAFLNVNGYDFPCPRVGFSYTIRSNVITMSMMEKQIGELRALRFRLGKYEKPLTEDWKIVDSAIDTIQALSAKLSASNLNNGWIPCEEHLPEDRSTVLATAYWHETYQVMMASYFGDGLWWCVPFNNCGEHMQRLKPIAWQPLPHPYKEKRGAK